MTMMVMITTQKISVQMSTEVFEILAKAKLHIVWCWHWCIVRHKSHNYSNTQVSTHSSEKYLYTRCLMNFYIPSKVVSSIYIGLIVVILWSSLYLWKKKKKLLGPPVGSICLSKVYSIRPTCKIWSHIFGSTL